MSDESEEKSYTHSGFDMVTYTHITYYTLHTIGSDLIESAKTTGDDVNDFN